MCHIKWLSMLFRSLLANPTRRPALLCLGPMPAVLLKVVMAGTWSTGLTIPVHSQLMLPDWVTLYQSRRL